MTELRIHLIRAVAPWVAVLAMSAVPATTATKGDGYGAGPLKISKESYELIVYSETGGMGYYNRALKNLTWPGGASGVTGGIGYDFGYNSREQIAADWSHLDAKRITAFQSVAGLKGQAAKAALSRVRSIIITWDEAMVVYQKKTMPRFGKMTSDAFPKLTSLHPHCQGTMLSQVFNRGAAMAGNSRLEMRQQRDAIAAGKPKPVPQYILNSRRLWVGKGLDGLLKRRASEATLFQKGLDS